MKKLFGIVITCFLIASCDIPRRLILINKTKNKVIVNLGSYPSGISETDMSQIELTQEKPKIHFLYGFGGFSEQDFENLKENFKEVQIISESDTIIINDREKLDNMLPRNRAGIFNSKMKIKIKNSS